MSASPADRTPGRTPQGPPPPLRRPRVVDPLVRPKPRRPQAPTAARARPPLGTNNAAPPIHQTGPVKSQAGTLQPGQPSNLGQPVRLGGHAAPTSLTNLIIATSDTAESGFTEAVEKRGDYVDYPVILNKRAFAEGLRPHIARFISKQLVDPSNEQEFTRPVRLHRRDPRAPAAGGNKGEEVDPKDAALAEEREQQELLRAQREAQREADMAEIAPSANNANAKRAAANKKKTQQVFRHDETEEQRAGTRLKYEEALPWHLEDDDNKQTWVGTYEAALSETYVQIVLKGDKFEVVPLEKWYKFNQNRNLKKEKVEEVVAKREKIQKDPEWLIRQKAAAENKRLEDEQRNKARRLFMPKRNSVATSGGSRRIKMEDDAEELDFDEDIADDDDGGVYEGDVDEMKEAEARIKKDQLAANVFDLKDEQSYDKAEEREKIRNEVLKTEGKKVRKALKRREKNYIYDSDSDHKYSESSESEDSETERLKEEQAKKEAEEKKLKASQTATGGTAKGALTPSNRPGKHLDPLQRNVSSNSLKRGVSPNVSDASGNESARKRQKKHKGPNTPDDVPSRPRPSDNNTHAQLLAAQQQSRRPSAQGKTLKRPRPSAGPGSDGEGAYSGAEMSDGGGSKSIKVKTAQPSSKNGSPGASRAGSPVREAQAGGSRAGSPGVGLPPVPSADEIRAVIPPQGITIANLLKCFTGTKVVAGDRKVQFFDRVRAVSIYERHTKLLKPNKA